jgi:hypothetical protein
LLRLLTALAIALALAVPPGAGTAAAPTGVDVAITSVAAALDAPAAPGAKTASALRAVAQAEGLDVAPLGACPTLSQALARHAERLGMALAAPAATSPDLDRALGCLLGALDEANRAQDTVFAGVDDATMARLYASEDDPAPDLLEALRGRDGRPILSAAIHVAEAVDVALPILGSIEQPATLTGLDLWPVLRFEPAGAQTYAKNYALIVDLDGDDTYDNHAGGVFVAVGNAFYDVEPGSEYLHVGPVQGWQAGVAGGTQDGDAVLSAGLVLDLAGNDVYGVKHPPALKDASAGCGTEPRVPYVGTIGAGIIGVGMLFDLSGDNAYIGRTQSQGAGHVFGVGALYTGPGRDTFEAVRAGQGSGLLGGFGLLINEGGDDEYRLAFPEGGVFNGDRRFCDPDARYGQGGNFDRKDGPFTPQVGILADLGGNDVYVSPHLSQGFSQGHGFGLLYDVTGSDSYTSGELAQGAGHGRVVEFDPQAIWSDGIGILVDREGDDAYSVGDKGQGWGMGDLLTNSTPPTEDLGEALLWAAHRNEAIGFLLDQAGTDTYTRPGRGDGLHGTDGTLGIYIDLA